MADHQIVSCPGCSKRYSVPPGVPPGQFQCQDCSAVVVYGRKAEGPPVHAGKGGAGKKGGGRAAAARRKIQNRRDEEEDEDDGRRRGPAANAKKPNATLYVMGILVLAVLGGGIAFAMSRGKGHESAGTTKTPMTTGKAGAGGVGIDEVAASGGGTQPPAPVQVAPPPPPPPPAPSPASTGGGFKTEVKARPAEEKFEPAANPPSGGNYGKTQSALLMALKADRASVITTLDQLPDTGADLARQIDEDVAKVADPSSGIDALKAQKRLIQVGRPAIPRVLSMAAKCDLSAFKDARAARDPCVVLAAVDEFMREVTGVDKFARLQYTPDAKLTTFEKTTEDWYVWWLSVGHRRAAFERKAAAADDE